ncbi:hypothetical protein [Sphingobacterium shayense]
MLNSEINGDLLPYALENELGIIVYSPMELGLLTGKILPGKPAKRQ